MKKSVCVHLLISTFTILLTACGFKQSSSDIGQNSTNDSSPAISETLMSESTKESETITAIPSFTPFLGSCSTPVPNELNDFINRSITSDDNGKTFIAHVTSRFWIYLDDRIYPLRDLLKSIPQGLIGYISNGSIRGPQCYPIMFEAVHEGKGQILLQDFQLSIIVDDNLPESPLPLH
jgi:hypothetical protein